jgi:hypothetical protein
MTSDLWNELVAQVEEHGPRAIQFSLEPDGTELEITDVKWNGNFIDVEMEVGG